MTLENPIFFFKGNATFCSYLYATPSTCFLLMFLDYITTFLCSLFIYLRYVLYPHHRRLLHTPDLALPTYLRTYRHVLLMLYNALLFLPLFNFFVNLFSNPLSPPPPVAKWRQEMLGRGK